MKECLEKYNYSGSLLTGPEFMVELGIDFYDIAYKDNKWWYACNDTEFPIRVYNGSGALVESISSSVLPAAHGMTFDSEGYLWVSNMNTDEIYKIADVSALSRATWASIKATF
jgi:hypothetical protein